MTWSWYENLTPGVATAVTSPERPSSSRRRSACLGSASYSTLSSCHVITRLNARASLASPGPGPRRGPSVISYSAAIELSSQSRLSAGPAEVKSSPWTEHAMPRSRWWNTLGCPKPWTNPIRTSVVLYSSCQPSAADLVPYMWRRSSPHMVARSGSSGGSSTKQGAASRSTFALKYARLMSMKLSWTRLLDLGSHTGWCGPQRVIVRLMTVRSASSGGAGAKYVSPERSSRFIWRATKRER